MILADMTSAILVYVFLGGAVAAVGCGAKAIGHFCSWIGRKM